MRKIIVSMLTVFMISSSIGITSVGASVSDSKLDNLNKNLEKIVDLQPGVSFEEMKETVSIYAEEINKTELEASKEILEEINYQIEQDEEEMAQLAGGSSGKYKLKPAKRKGDIFYTPSSTLGIKHGHNGIYYTKTKIVESIPKTGVRTLGYNKRNVEKYAVMQYVKTSQTKRNKAANWAHSRSNKDKYSYNFATNRKTSHYGKKNCSKLLWSAYKLKAKIDIDKNKGSGVYPKDIRNSPKVVTYKTIK